jgi:hypothetical protein
MGGAGTAIGGVGAIGLWGAIIRGAIGLWGAIIGGGMELWGSIIGGGMELWGSIITGVGVEAGTESITLGAADASPVPMRAGFCTDS